MYFSPAVVDDYGLLARQSLESLQAGARVEVAEHKRSPVDFALWKFAKPGEPSWPSPWGDGRPGWHTECVVMSLDLLGDGFDIHGGGLDLAFPHHENERAQAVAAGRTFARHWVHNGFVEVGGEKMSKSLGNFTNLLDLVESTDPRAYRLLVLRAHYRTPLEISKATTDDAAAALKKFDSLARSLAEADLPDGRRPTPRRSTRFRAAMDDDLDTPRRRRPALRDPPRANTALDIEDLADAAARWARRSSRSPARSAWCSTPAATRCPAEVLAVARQRDEARAAKDWAPRRRACATSSSPTVGSWRTPRRARRSVPPDGRRAVARSRLAVTARSCRAGSVSSGPPSPSTSSASASSCRSSRSTPSASASAPPSSACCRPRSRWPS